MICRNCNNEFDANKYKNICPFCNGEFSNDFQQKAPMLKFNDAVQAVRYLLDVYGKGIISNEDKFLELVCDAIPNLTKEKNWFFHMHKEGVFYILYNEDSNSRSRQKQAIELSVKKLVDNVGLSEKSALQAVSFLTEAMKWNDEAVSKEYKIPKSGHKKKKTIALATAVVLALSAIIIGVVCFKKEDIETEIKEEPKREINYSETVDSKEGTYKNALSEKKGSTLIAGETITLSTKNEKTVTQCGVEFNIIKSEFTATSFNYIYEIYNPTDNPIKFSNSTSVLYNTSNEIIDRADFLYSVKGEYEGDIILPKSSILLEINSSSVYLNRDVKDFDRIETDVRIYNVDIEAAEDICISDVIIENRYVKYKIIAGKNAPKYASWKITFWDKEGRIVAYADGGSRLTPDSTEHMSDEVILSGNGAPIENIVFGAYTDD